jgi:nicotinamide-nucleotide amidase
VTIGTLDGIQIRRPDEPVRAAVLSVGSELLLGDLTDTNATWVSQRLRELGVEVLHHLAVRDDLDQLVEALGWLAARVHLVVVGGGLGPTMDDLTREAVAAAAGVPLEARADLEELLERRFAKAGRRWRHRTSSRRVSRRARPPTRRSGRRRGSDSP